MNNYPVPRSPSDFSILAARYMAAITNVVQRKTKDLSALNGFAVAFFLLSLAFVFAYQMDWFRFQWRYHNNSTAIVTKERTKEKRVAAAIVNDEQTGNTPQIEGFEGLDGVLDESTGQKFDGEKKNSSTESSSKPNFNISPASPEELRETNVKGFIEQYSKIAVAEMDKFGIPASISMAQAIVESRSGTSVLAARNNNHFGIKCFSKSCPKGHCSNYTDDSHKDFFRKYANATDSWREHSQFLMKYRYRDLLKYGKNYRVWAKGLREFGYATDKNYDKKLISIIERYELFKLDDL